MGSLLRRIFGKQRSELLKKARPLTCTKDGRACGEELYLASALLLLEAGAGDGKLPADEIKWLQTILSDQFELPLDEAEGIIDSASKMRNDRDGLKEITKSIREHYDEDQRQHLLALLWKIMLADGVFEKTEKRVLNGIAFHLGVSEDALEEARHRAEHELP